MGGMPVCPSAGERTVARAWDLRRQQVTVPRLVQPVAGAALVRRFTADGMAHEYALPPGGMALQTPGRCWRRASWGRRGCGTTRHSSPTSTAGSPSRGRGRTFATTPSTAGAASSCSACGRSGGRAQPRWRSGTPDADQLTSRMRATWRNGEPEMARVCSKTAVHRIGDRTRLLKSLLLRSSGSPCASIAASRFSAVPARRREWDWARSPACRRRPADAGAGRAAPDRRGR